MPFMCCVAYCNGKYRKGPRVSVFSFPRDKVLAGQWLRSIKRNNFTPTAKVCERHFTEDDLGRRPRQTDAQTGISLTAPLKETVLHPEAVPSILAQLPYILSTPQTLKTQHLTEEKIKECKQ
ncbi:THAP domain-containing protein 1 [Chionoecetes opilio]|uniref:THAP domain-containing protein 1 n=1 Tax=Chionoecetes opilio TaxID=41210 RepID=A0A8J5CLN9_CHIOP|nr:THAP domain-containing protein 1 [Chionoecetes opilio]